MFTGFDTHDAGARRSGPAPFPSFDTASEADALLEDLAVDPSDLLDLAALRGVAFRNLVTELLAARSFSGGDRIAKFDAGHPRPEQPPFVWVRLLPPRGARPTVRAGWLTADVFDAIVAEARAGGRGTRVEVIVPLDSGAAAVERVRALCPPFADDQLVVIVQARSNPVDGRRRRGHARARAARARTHHGTWAAFDLIGVRS